MGGGGIGFSGLLHSQRFCDKGSLCCCIIAHAVVAVVFGGIGFSGLLYSRRLCDMGMLQA